MPQGKLERTQPVRNGCVKALTTAPACPAGVLMLGKVPFDPLTTRRPRI